MGRAPEQTMTRVEDEAIDEFIDHKWTMYDGQDLKKYLKAGKGQGYDN